VDVAAGFLKLARRKAAPQRKRDDSKRFMYKESSRGTFAISEDGSRLSRRAPRVRILNLGLLIFHYFSTFSCMRRTVRSSRQSTQRSFRARQTDACSSSFAPAKESACAVYPPWRVEESLPAFLYSPSTPTQPPPNPAMSFPPQHHPRSSPQRTPRSIAALRHGNPLLATKGVIKVCYFIQSIIRRQVSAFKWPSQKHLCSPKMDSPLD
jgi:hypothetical protein